MGGINARRVDIRSGTSTFATLDDYLKAKDVYLLPFNETAKVTVSGANVTVIDSSMTVASLLAIGSTTTTNGGLVAMLAAGAVGTGATTTLSDSLGNVTNAVPIRDATTHNLITESGGKEVYALIHAASTVTDGDAIGAAASENVQLSFVYTATDGTVTLTSITATIEFGQKNMYYKRQRPEYMQVGGNPDAEVLISTSTSATQGNYVVTTAFAAGEVITLSTGAGAGSGVTTMTGDTIALGVDAATFNANNLLQVFMDGIEGTKAVDVIYDSSTTFHFALALDVGDRFVVRLLA